jgi:hypothetical protein
VPAGVPEPYSVTVCENSHAAVLVISKARFDSVIAHYPEQIEIILTNLLYQYSLTRDGNDTGGSRHIDISGDDGYVKLRSDIKARAPVSHDSKSQ